MQKSKLREVSGGLLFFCGPLNRRKSCIKYNNAGPRRLNQRPDVLARE